MKKFVIYSFLSLLTVVLTGCPFSAEDGGDRVTIVNKADYNISCFFSWYSHNTFDPIYPDTTISVNRQKGLEVADKNKPTYMYVYSIEKTFKEEQTDTICFFIFHSDTVVKYDWDVICREYKILQRYDLSLQDFKRLKYTITYPPDETMRDVKMYPPYQ